MPIAKKPRAQDVKNEATLQRLLKRCDETWLDMHGLCSMAGGGDTRAYGYGGMYIHPCGATGKEFCSCKLCDAMRRITPYYRRKCIEFTNKINQLPEG
jgi:hypothetical protein